MHYMIIKPTKSNFLANSTSHVLLNEVPLNKVASLKLLGIIISNNLQWNDHVTHLKGKINQKLNALRHFGSHLDLQRHLLDYNIFIRPHLMYGAQVWGNSSSAAVAT